VSYLTGEYKVTLDEKGRISLPANLRKILDEKSLFLTESADNCLWLYPSGEWKEMLKTIMDNTDPFSANYRTIRRRIVGPSQEVEIDKAGRIPVAQSLRDFAGLSKDCVVLGQVEYIEIWAEEKYRAYKTASNEELVAGSEELSGILKRKRGIED
jgi:MraZ protein